MGNENLLIEGDITEYKGNWVAIYDKKVIAYGKGIKQVHENACKLQPNNEFIMHYIPEKFYPQIMKEEGLVGMLAS